MSRVVVAGSANADLVVEVARRPAGGETLLGGELTTLPGGKGANQAAAAAHAGAPTSFLGAVGADDHGNLLITSLEHAGVDTTSVLRSSRPTGTAIIMVTPDGENSIVVSQGAGADCTPAQFRTVAQVWRDADVVALSLEISLDTIELIATDAHQHGTRVVLNAAPAATLSPAALAACDPLIVNEHEAVDMLGGSAVTAPEKLAQALRELGPRSVVITLGPRGATIADDSGARSLPAYAVTPVDTTGAGDAFVGALSAELARGHTLDEAVEFAQAMAAISVQRLGAQTSYVSESAVREFMRQQATH